MEIALAFLGAGIGNSVRSMLTKRKYTLFLCVALSVGAACLVYAGCLKGAKNRAKSRPERGLRELGEGP